MIYLHALASSWRLQGFFLEDALPSNTTTVAWAIWEFWHFHLKFRIFMQLWRIPSIHTTKSKYVQWSLSMSPQNACAIIRRRKNELKFLNPKINFAWTIFLQNILSLHSDIPCKPKFILKNKTGSLAWVYLSNKHWLLEKLHARCWRTNTRFYTSPDSSN